MSSKVKYIKYYGIVNAKIREGQADVQVTLRRHDGEVNAAAGANAAEKFCLAIFAG